MKNINIEKLVSDIKSGEAAYRGSSWDIWCQKRGLGATASSGTFYPADYVAHMTGLYTLRAFTRGRMHRRNPPASIRDYNRSMEDSGRSERMAWDMEVHNGKIAERFADSYGMEEAA